MSSSTQELSGGDRLAAALASDRLERVARGRREIRGLQWQRVLLTVVTLSAGLIALGEWSSFAPLWLLDSQQRQVLNPVLVASWFLAAVGLVCLYRQWFLKLRLDELGSRWWAEDTEAGPELLELSQPWHGLWLLALALLPALGLQMAWTTVRSLGQDEQLRQAVARNDLPGARQALQLGARSNPRPGTQGYAPLGAAVERRNPQMVELLLQNGADPLHLPTKEPLQLAVSLKERKMIRLMLPYVQEEHSPWTRAELSIMTGDVATIQQELSAPSVPPTGKRLRELATAHGTMRELGEAVKRLAAGDKGPSRYRVGEPSRPFGVFKQR